MPVSTRPLTNSFSLPPQPPLALHVETTSGGRFDATDRPVRRSTLISTVTERADDIRKLNIESLAPEDARELQKLLDAGMVQLDSLRIIIEDRVAAKTRPAAIFSLHHQRLPELRKLKLENVGVMLPPIVASRLRILRILNAPGAPTWDMRALRRFLDALSAGSVLEELVLSYCVDAATQGYPAGPLPSPTQRLRYVDLEEHPHVVSMILSSLYVPASATVHLRGNLHGVPPERYGEACMAILPKDRSRLPVLGQICSLNVSHTRDGEESFFHFFGTARCKATLELHFTADLPDPTRTGPRGDFETIVRLSSKLFPTATVETLAFHGELDSVASASWIAVLQQFPQLRHLRFEHASPAGSLQTVIAALKTLTLTQKPPRPICPLMETLRLEGGIGGGHSEPDVVEAVLGCLEWRRKHATGGPPMFNGFSLLLYCKRSPWTTWQIDHFRQKFSRLAKKSTLDIMEDPSMDGARQ